MQQALIDQYAKDNKIDIAQGDIDKKEADIKSKYPPGQFEQILKQQGLTETDVQNILRQQLVIEKAVAPMVHVTDADVAAYFAKNHATLDTKPQVRARHILVADQKTADMIEAKLKSGGNFADLAKQYSTDPSTKDKGGELGFFTHGQMVPAFDAAAFALPVGAISAPVKSPFGWHIIQVEERKPAVIATLKNSAATIRTTLTAQQQQQQIPVFLQQLRSKANITIDDDRFKDAFPPAAPPPAATSPRPRRQLTPTRSQPEEHRPCHPERSQGPPRSRRLWRPFDELRVTRVGVRSKRSGPCCASSDSVRATPIFSPSVAARRCVRPAVR